MFRSCFGNPRRDDIDEAPGNQRPENGRQGCKHNSSQHHISTISGSAGPSYRRSATPTIPAVHSHPHEVLEVTQDKQYDLQASAMSFPEDPVKDLHKDLDSHTDPDLEATFPAITLSAHQHKSFLSQEPPELGPALEAATGVLGKQIIPARLAISSCHSVETVLPLHSSPATLAGPAEDPCSRALMQSSPNIMTAIWLDDCSGNPVAFQSPLSIRYYGDLVKPVGRSLDSRCAMQKSVDGSLPTTISVLQKLFALEGEQLLNESLAAVLPQGGEGQGPRSWQRVMRVPGSFQGQKTTSNTHPSCTVVNKRTANVQGTTFAASSTRLINSMSTAVLPSTVESASTALSDPSPAPTQQSAKQQPLALSVQGSQMGIVKSLEWSPPSMAGMHWDVDQLDSMPTGQLVSREDELASLSMSLESAESRPGISPSKAESKHPRTAAFPLASKRCNSVDFKSEQEFRFRADVRESSPVNRSPPAFLSKKNSALSTWSSILNSAPIQELETEPDVSNKSWLAPGVSDARRSLTSTGVVLVGDHNSRSLKESSKEVEARVEAVSVAMRCAPRKIKSLLHHRMSAIGRQHDNVRAHSSFSTQPAGDRLHSAERSSSLPSVKSINTALSSCHGDQSSPSATQHISQTPGHSCWYDGCTVDAKSGAAAACSPHSRGATESTSVPAEYAASGSTSTAVEHTNSSRTNTALEYTTKGSTSAGVEFTTSGPHDCSALSNGQFDIESIMVQTLHLATAPGIPGLVPQNRMQQVQGQSPKVPMPQGGLTQLLGGQGREGLVDTIGPGCGRDDGPEQRGDEEREPAGHCWHDVYMTRVKDDSGRDLLLLYQTDVTVRTHMETAMTELTGVQLDVLCQMFPRHFIEETWSQSLPRLPSPQQMGRLARCHHDVTILFMDIVGFTSMAHQVPPEDVMIFLNVVFSTFDDLSGTHKVQKVETAGDCYIVAAGILSADIEGFNQVTSCHDAHASAAKVLAFAKNMMAASRKMVMPHDGSPLKIRIGIHTGECVSGMVGSRMPKFSIFGDTMNTASRMESTCIPGRIQISASTHSLVVGSGLSSANEWDATGGVQVKGKGTMNTYLWREGQNYKASTSDHPGQPVMIK